MACPVVITVALVPELLTIPWWRKGAIAGFATLFLVAFYLDRRRRTTIKERGDEIGALKGQLAVHEDRADLLTNAARNAIHGWIVIFAEGCLGFGVSHGNDERITVYLHNPSIDQGGRQGYFVSVARHSLNPRYRQSGRRIHPDFQGCIARAWENRESFISDLPDPIRDLESYMAKSEDYGYSPEVVNAFTMKSRLYFGYAITDAANRERLAVLIVESTRQRAYTRARLREAIETQAPFLADLLCNFRPYLPDPAVARRVGL